MAQSLQDEDAAILDAQKHRLRLKAEDHALKSKSKWSKGNADLFRSIATLVKQTKTARPTAIQTNV
jgi:hypothetical protein